MLKLADTFSALAPNETTDAMDDERRQDSPGRRETDAKPSPWADPRLWIAVLALMLTIGLALLANISSQLAAINANGKATNDAVIMVTTKQMADTKATEDRLSKLENAVTTQQQAYNFNFTTRLAAVEAKSGVKPRNGDQ